MRYALALSLLLIATPASAENRYPARVVSIADADTFTLAIAFEWGVGYTGPVRVANFDAFEVSRRRRTVKVSDAELVKGKAARDLVVAWFARAKSIEVIPDASRRRDVYGRPLVRVVVDGEDLGDAMRAAGYDRR